MALRVGLRVRARLRRAPRLFGRIGALLMALAILNTSTPAATQILTLEASNLQTELAFWVYASGWADTLRGLGGGESHRPPTQKKQEKQEERDARIARIEISPGDVTLREGERVVFAAIAFDADGNSAGGARVKWGGADTGRGKAVHVSPRGEFKATAEGTYVVTAEINGKKAQVKVTVKEGARPKRGEKPTSERQVSTRDQMPDEAAARRKQKKGRVVETPKKDEVGERRDAASDARDGAVFTKASYTPDATPRKASGGAPRGEQPRAAATATAAAAYMLPVDSWNETNYGAADDPGNQPGNPPGAPQDGGAGNGNFQIAAPLLNLPGRGLDLSLGLAYNSRLWTKSGSQMTYDMDRGWPAAGWSLGFGKMVGMNTSGSMIIEPDGTRRAFTGRVDAYSWGGTYFTAHSTDGSLIDYWSYSYNGVISSGYARLANGTWIDYGAAGDGAIYPTRITDANGNFVTVTYVNNQGPRIQTVTDTLGRAINFNYDGSGLLTAVTAPGLGGGTRTLVRLHYRQLTLQAGFAYPLTATARNYYPMALDAIYYPGTGNGYWFGDSDSYSSYGMISKVVEQRGMGFSAGSLNEQGTVAQGAMTKQVVYNYPLAPNYGLTDAPTYTTQTASWTRDGSNVDSATTTYAINLSSNPRTVAVTLPNGTKSVQYSFNAPGQYYDGLVYRDETYDAAGSLLRYSTANWAQGAYDSPRATRTAETDERGQTKATEYAYGSVYNQITEVRNINYDGTLLRATRTQYNNAAAYTNRHIFNLSTAVEVYAGDGVTRVSRTDYQYDGQALYDTPGVVQHSDASNPYAPQYWVEGQCWYDCVDYCYYTCDPGYWQTDYDPSTDYRGNVTQVTTYADAANLTGAVVSTRRYDITGNMVTSTSSCCQQTTTAFTSDTQYAYATAETRGSASDASAQVRTTATFDFNTGLPLSTTDINGRTSQTVYYPETLRPQYSYKPTGAYTATTYDEVAMAVTETTYTAGGAAIGEQKVTRLNGVGKPRREEALGAGGAWDVVETQYDAMGRVAQQSRPFRNGQQGPQWTSTSYDALSRVVAEQSPDGSIVRTYYDEAARPAGASSQPGETIRAVDAWGRERWARADALGRMVEVIEPDAYGGGSVAQYGMVTTYGYNALDKLTSVTQGPQTRSFRYDSLGRMTHQRLAEKSPTLNDAGQYVGGGAWTDVFTYDDRSNLTSHIDARGVKTLYNYGNDPLKRILSVSYDLSGFGDTSHPVVAAPGVTYQYRSNAGGTQRVDVTDLSSVTIAGVMTESYSYDAEARVSAKNITFDSRPYHPMTVDYVYDSLDRVTDVRYPAQYGMGGSPRKLVHHDYDAASRVSGLQVDGASYASEIGYNAESQATRIRVGYGGSNQKTETYEYDGATGLLTHHVLAQDGNPNALLDLSYDYLRAGTSSGRTGQVTRVLNNRDHNKDRGYEYDALGRLLRATGGQSPNWAQRYFYDRHGNRSNALSYTAEQYVRNFYQVVQGHQPSSGDLAHWLWVLQTAYAQGGEAQMRTKMAELGDAIFNSSEYAARNRTNQEYVYDLYKAYLFRDPDQSGWNFWTGEVGLNGRAAVRAGFSGSYEFYLKVSGTSPYSPPSGVAVPRDGWEALTYDQTSNRINTAGWEYDAAGNQTRAQRSSDGGWNRFQYDTAGRLSRVTDDAGNTLASYAYMAGRERVIADEVGVRTYFVWDGPGVVTEYREGASAPAWQKNYVYLGARLLATQQASGAAEVVQYHHPDELGTRVVSNASDANVSEQATLPFGTLLTTESSATVSTRRFTSYDHSATTGLDNAVNRQYDSAQGRFTQPDPLGMNAANLIDPQSLNLYSYCGNDPVNRTDPDGLFWGKLFKWVSKAFRWIGIVLTVAVLVVTAAIIFAPASSFIFKAALWMLGHVLIPLSHLPVLGGMIPLGALATPTWNPSGKGFFGNSFVQDGQQVTCSKFPDCSDVITLPSEAVTIVEKLPWHRRGILGTIGDWATGVADEVTTVPFTSLSLTKWWRHRNGWEGDADESSAAYRYGGYTGTGFEVVIGALTGASEARAAGFGARWIRKNVIGTIPAKGQNIGRGFQILGGKLKYMKHAAHRAVHTLPHHQIEIGGWKIRHIIGKPIWKWTKGPF